MSSSWLALTNPVGEEMFKSWAGDEFILMGLDRGEWVGVGGSDLRVCETFKPSHIYSYNIHFIVIRLQFPLVSPC